MGEKFDALQENERAAVNQEVARRVIRMIADGKVRDGQVIGPKEQDVMKEEIADSADAVAAAVRNYVKDTSHMPGGGSPELLARGDKPGTVGYFGEPYGRLAQPEPGMGGTGAASIKKPSEGGELPGKKLPGADRLEEGPRRAAPKDEGERKR